MVAGPGSAEKTVVGGLPSPPMPSSPVDEPDRAVAARDLPVALAHVAHEHRVELEVHRVELAEVGLAEQRLRRAHQRQRVRVALGGVPVAVGHQIGCRQQRQLLEAPVPADRVEVRGEAPVALLLEQAAQRDLVAHRVGVRLAGQGGVDLEPLRVLGDQRVDLLLADLLHQRVEPAEILGDDLRTQPPQHRGRVIEDVAHTVHRVAEQGDPVDLSAVTVAAARAHSPKRLAKKSESHSPVITENGTPERTSAFAWSWAPWMPWL